MSNSLKDFAYLEVKNEEKQEETYFTSTVEDEYGYLVQPEQDQKKRKVHHFSFDNALDKIHSILSFRFSEDAKSTLLIFAFSVLLIIGLGHFLQSLNSDSRPSNRSHYSNDQKSNVYGTDRELGEYIENYQQERGYNQ